MDKLKVLKEYYGYDSFRPIQNKAIDSILQGHDTICLLATGGGKSLIYQIPALLFEGTTIVVTPLISLMVDQVMQLKKKKISACYINSTMDEYEIINVYNKIKSRCLKLIYVSPERLQSQAFIDAIKNINIPLLCLDESHSVETRYDFRPSYSKIDEYITKLNKRPIIAAVTATATNDTILDIINVCNMKKPNIYKSTFDRPNLYYGVVHTKSKLEYLSFYINKNKDIQGIIYCMTRMMVEKLYNYLNEKGYSVTYYHGGMDKEEKNINQNLFTENEKKIMIATISFGLGIDIPTIRYVIVYDIPSSIEDLVQMVGRCSRDGAYGEGLLLYSKEDIKTGLHYIYQMENKNDNRLFLQEKTKRKNKIYSVVNYCTTNKCLHNEILKYFDEYKYEKCNNCSNCKSKNRK